jgi:hypothetical protein
MAIGSYGTIRPSDVSPADVEIIMNYTATRDVTDQFVLTKLDAQTILRPYFANSETGGNPDVEVLGGLYNLTLPATQFNALGIYTLYIRPAEIRTVISDCGVLSALPNVKGIIIDISDVPTQYQNKFVPQGLVGFRVEYLNPDGSNWSGSALTSFDAIKVILVPSSTVIQIRKSGYTGNFEDYRETMEMLDN